MTRSGLAHRTTREWFSSFPAVILLLGVVIYSTSSDIHNQLLQLGQQTWSGYYELRTDPISPSCDPDPDIEAELQQLVRAQENAVADDIDALFADEPVDKQALRKSLENARDACIEKHARFESLDGRITSGLTAFRSVELFIADLIAFGLSSQRVILALLIIICAMTATLTRHHIAMRPMESRLDHTLSSFLQFLANSMLFFSMFSYRELSYQDGAQVDIDKAAVLYIWVIGFAAMAVISLMQTMKPPAEAKSGGTLGHALLSVPLYTIMCLIAGTYFLLGDHYAGIGIYADKLMDFADLMLNIGLYVWIGMMLKETQLATLVFNVFRPWKMPPEMLAFAAILVTALPTAYTGGSGIFVIAAGSVVYLELRKAGARRQLALATTAMSGSMGVVLRPCLLVVIIAYLNREVTTDQLFSWGARVFLLTAFLFFVVSMLNRREKVQFASAAEAFPEMMRAFRPIIPYVLVVAAVVLGYRLILDVGVNEFSAPRILPVIMLAILVYEHVRFRKSNESLSGEIDHKGLEASIRNATTDTTVHFGALLLLMGLSISIGGVIEDSQIMHLFPTDFASVWGAMALLVVMLVIIGMIMDPYGAVILVNATLKTIAVEAGIDPLHFWMVTLVAFELGYLSPPVALNHLLTRQVVGEAEVKLARITEGSFFERHEKIIMPLIVMGTALLIVAFVPLLIGYS